MMLQCNWMSEHAVKVLVRITIVEKGGRAFSVKLSGVADHCC
jgi:hypothetical protein